MRLRRAQDVSSATVGIVSRKHQVRKQLKQCQLTNALSGDGHASLMTRSIAPMAIIGGTFSVYSSAMKVSHKNSDLTPLSILYLLLLALNYVIMPRLSRRFIHPKTNKRSVALAEELVKMTLGLGGWVMSSYVAASDLESTTSTTMPSTTTTISILSDQLQNWSPTSTLLAAGIPSALYALQAILTYNAYQNLDPVTYNNPNNPIEDIDVSTMLLYIIAKETELHPSY